MDYINSKSASYFPKKNRKLINISIDKSLNRLRDITRTKSSFFSTSIDPMKSCEFYLKERKLKINSTSKTNKKPMSSFHTSKKKIVIRHNPEKIQVPDPKSSLIDESLEINSIISLNSNPNCTRSSLHRFGTHFFSDSKFDLIKDSPKDIKNDFKPSTQQMPKKKSFNKIFSKLQNSIQEELKYKLIRKSQENQIMFNKQKLFSSYVRDLINNIHKFKVTKFENQVLTENIAQRDDEEIAKHNIINVTSKTLKKNVSMINFSSTASSNLEYQRIYRQFNTKSSKLQ